ncbi:protein of unknown function [Shewanella benthica]|uniref:Uncharacterized protein n=1 Tax=Shewanella benthica TaxID=43661 RepID=A0A330LXZ0_9GAMM|nr:protein of unknown function [Shewanella benthica]
MAACENLSVDAAASFDDMDVIAEPTWKTSYKIKSRRLAEVPT